MPIWPISQLPSAWFSCQDAGTEGTDSVFIWDWVYEMIRVEEFKMLVRELLN